MWRHHYKCRDVVRNDRQSVIHFNEHFNEHEILVLLYVHVGTCTSENTYFILRHKFFVALVLHIDCCRFRSTLEF